MYCPRHHWTLHCRNEGVQTTQTARFRSKAQMLGATNKSNKRMWQTNRQTHARAHTHKQARTHARTHPRTHAHMHARTHPHTNTRTQTRLHAYAIPRDIDVCRLRAAAAFPSFPREELTAEPGLGFGSRRSSPLSQIWGSLPLGRNTRPCSGRHRSEA